MRVLAYLAAYLSFPALLAADTVLLDFTADWCGPCQEMVPILAKLEREGYSIERINIDQDRGRAQQFGVRSVPTFVVLSNGREVKRLVGATSADTLRRILGPVEGSIGPSSRVEPASIAAPDRRPPSAPPAAAATAGMGLIHRSARLVVDDPKGRAFGTGTVIRSVPGETLVLTCSHLFDGDTSGRKATIELFGSATPRRLTGELVARDREADIALVRISSDQVFPSAPIAPRRFPLAPGLPAHSVGCDHGQQPSIRAMRVTAVNRYLGAPTIECTGQPVQGRSGGGLFNQAGELMGVCSAADPAERRGIYAGLAAIHALLDRQGLASLADRSASSESPLAVATAQEKPSRPALSVPPPETLGLNTRNEFTALKSAAAAEVVCVIRQGSPESPARVVVLQQVSPEFLAQLEKEQAAQQSRSAPPASAAHASEPGTGAAPATKPSLPGAVASSGTGTSPQSSAWRPVSAPRVPNTPVAGAGRVQIRP
jgi:thiol-disulfide isomerase/thioredoxin